MNEWIIAIIIIGIAIIISILLSKRRTWRRSESKVEVEDEIVDEEEEVDELEEDEEVDEDKSYSPSFNPIKLISTIISLVMFAIVGWMIFSQITPLLNTQMNASGIGIDPVVTNSIITFLPIFGILIFVFIILSAFGLGVGGSDDIQEQSNTPRINYKTAKDRMRTGRNK